MRLTSFPLGSSRKCTYASINPLNAPLLASVNDGGTLKPGFALFVTRHIRSNQRFIIGSPRSARRKGIPAPLGKLETDVWAPNLLGQVHQPSREQGEVLKVAVEAAPCADSS